MALKTLDQQYTSIRTFDARSLKDRLLMTPSEYTVQCWQIQSPGVYDVTMLYQPL